MYFISSASKNAMSTKRINAFFNNLNKNQKLNLNVTKNCQKSIKKKQLLTILKSPHVNKTAQEQFEFKAHSNFFLIKPANQNFKFLLALKKIMLELFTDTKISVKLISNKKTKNQNSSKIFNFNNFKTNKKLHIAKEITTKLNILNNYGELINMYL